MRRLAGLLLGCALATGCVAEGNPNNTVTQADNNNRYSVMAGSTWSGGGNLSSTDTVDHWMFRTDAPMVDVAIATGAWQGAQYAVNLCTLFKYENNALVCDTWQQLGAGTVGSSSSSQPSVAQLSNMGTMTLCEVANAAGGKLPCANLKWLRMTLKSGTSTGYGVKLVARRS